MLWENGEEITIDLDALEAAFKAGARAFLFSNPNNPTGTVHGPETVQKVAALALRYNVFVVADELYSRLLYDGRHYQPFAAIHGMRERTVTLLGPSTTEPERNIVGKGQHEAVRVDSGGARLTKKKNK